MLTENKQTNQSQFIANRKNRKNKKIRWFGLLGMLLLFGSAFAGCFDTIKTSQDLACDKASDCWDGLPCVEKVCGGKVTPKPEPKPRQDSGNEAIQPEKTVPETPADIACPVPQGSVLLCNDNSACKSNKCNAFSIPGCAKKSKACICTTKADCKSTESCCPFGTVSICSPFPCKKP